MNYNLVSFFGVSSNGMFNCGTSLVKSEGVFDPVSYLEARKKERPNFAISINAVLPLTKAQAERWEKLQ